MKKKILTFTTINSGLSNQLLLQKQDYTQIKEILDLTHRYLEDAARKTESQIILSAHVIFLRIHSFSEQINNAINIDNYPTKWDYRVLFLNARALIEAVEMLFFIFLDHTSKDNKKFRILCLKLHNIKYIIDLLNEGKNKNELEEGIPFLDYDKRINQAEKTQKELIEEVEKNELFKNLKNKDIQGRIKAGHIKFFHEKFNTDEMIEFIEIKMGIIRLSLYKIAYFNFSSVVHPYLFQIDSIFDYLNDAEKLSSDEATSNILALHIIILYLRYSTAKTIDELLSDENNSLLSPGQIYDLKCRRKLLGERPKSIRNAKALR